jgi:hypothetical protein
VSWTAVRQGQLMGIDLGCFDLLFGGLVAWSLILCVCELNYICLCVLVLCVCLCVFVCVGGFYCVVKRL